jgi:hypothetical protein
MPKDLINWMKCPYFSKDKGYKIWLNKNYKI